MPGPDAGLDVDLGTVRGQQARSAAAGSRAARSARGASAGSPTVSRRPFGHDDLPGDRCPLPPHHAGATCSSLGRASLSAVRSWQQCSGARPGGPHGPKRAARWRSAGLGPHDGRSGTSRIGFPRMYNEPGERRAFLPPLMRPARRAWTSTSYVEAGAGPAWASPTTTTSRPRRGSTSSTRPTAYDQDIVVVLRAPEGRYELIRPGAILLSMLHFTTRPERVELLREPGHRGDRARHGHRRRRPAPGPEPARRGPQRPRRRLRRPRAPLAAAARRPTRPPSASRSWAPAGSASTPSSGRPRAATTRATRGSCATACPGSRSWWSSRTWPATRPTSGTASR